MLSYGLNTVQIRLLPAIIIIIIIIIHERNIRTLEQSRLSMENNKQRCSGTGCFLTVNTTGHHSTSWANSIHFTSSQPTVKVKWYRYRTGVAQRVGRGIALLLHDRGTRRGVSGQQHAPAALYPRERPGTHCRGWVGSRAGLDGRKISSPPGFDSGPSSSVAQSLYRLSYPVHRTYCTWRILKAVSHVLVTLSLTTGTFQCYRCSHVTRVP